MISDILVAPPYPYPSTSMAVGVANAGPAGINQDRRSNGQDNPARDREFAISMPTTSFSANAQCGDEICLRANVQCGPDTCYFAPGIGCFMIAILLIVLGGVLGAVYALSLSDKMDKMG